jgi:hypothetical protein
MTRRIIEASLFLYLLVSLAVSPLFIYGQVLKKFSGDSTKFVAELDMLFQALPDNEQKISAKLMSSFIQKWNAEKFNPAEKKSIYSVCNQMLQKRMRTFPDFYNYIEALDFFVNAQKPDEIFYEWSEVVDKLLKDKNNRYYLAFIENSVSLFSENLVFKSQSAQWKILNPGYHFLFDSVPMIRFARSDLVCYSNDDSLFVKDTKGTYYPLTSRWIGQGGHVDWARAGLDPEKVFAVLHDYDIQMKFAKLVADSVEFYHKKYFSFAILGRYTDQAQADVPEQRASFPRFESYDKNIGIQNLFRNIDFLGGIALEGPKLIGSGSNSGDARLVMKRDGKELIRLNAKFFIILPGLINASSTSMTLYYENDSIFHPALQMKYIDERKELTLSKDEKMRTFSPWFDSYHKIEIYCEELSWVMNEPNIGFGMMRGPNQQGKAVFESSNYYTLGRYDKLQGIDERNPLSVLKRFSEQKKKRDFTLEELCSFMERPTEQVEAMLLNLTTRGYLIYDPDDKNGKINQKLFDYVNAKNNKTDYDVIFFNSEVHRKSNAILSIDSFDLRLQGVPSVYLSDSQQVVIYPKDQEIILKKNRNFLFSGKIEAGLFDLFARDCRFDYNRFMLDMPNVDSMSFFVGSREINPISGQRSLVKVKTNITKVTGELLIDDPGNKSGLKPFPQYPLFISKTDAIVTWDKKYIQNGVYKKENFFYKVYPFKFKNLDSFPTDSLTFKGYLSSAGIFPEIEQPLKVRPDYSLGIETKTDTAGLPLYGDKGRFVNRIDLSNAGLRGDGKIYYLNSVTTSKDFIFFPDSMKTLTRQFDLAQMMGEVEYPSVHGDSVTELWIPYKDSLIVSSGKWNFKKDFAMYNNQSKFSGNLSLTPAGLTGNGTVKIKDAEMDSKKFLFKQKTFDANIANFRIKSYDLADLSISTKNYQTHFDFEKRKGEFKSNIGISRVDFPLNKYSCTMDRFDWLIDSEEIAFFNNMSTKLAAADTMSLASLIDFDLSGSEFIAEDPKMDSLRFLSLHATYNLKSNLINAEHVKIIKVADAAIYPDSGKVTILRNGQMKPLARSIILANQKTRFHQFYNTTTLISSRKSYSSSGSYDYIDRNGERYPVSFSRIYVDTMGTTKAEGYIPDSTMFRLSPEFAFTGSVGLEAGRKNLDFNGGFKVITDCFKNSRWWVKFRAEIDPKNIQLPVSYPLLDIHNEKILLGMGFCNTENKIYPAFFIKKQYFNDTVMVAVNGMLSYNENNEVFKVSAPENNKIQANTSNSFSLVTEKCLFHTEGRLNLNLNSGPMKMETYGTLNNYVIPDSTLAKVSIAFNFPFSDALVEKLGQHVQSVNLNGITVANTPYYAAMRSIMGQKEFDKVKSDLELLGKFKKFPEELTRTLFFADINFHWDSTAKSWISNGPIGIGNIGKTQVNRYANGIMEFTRKKNGDEFTIYLELAKSDWYFFNYRNNILQVLSSDLAFNDMIMEAQKSKAEQKRLDDISKNFRYIISTDRKKRDFLRKFETEE